MNATNENVIEKDNFFVLNTKDCTGKLSLFDSNVQMYYNYLMKGEISNLDFKRILDINHKVDESRINKEYKILNEKYNIIDNFLFFKPQTKIKLTKTIKIENITLPKDLIPLNVYIPDFIEKSQRCENTFTKSGSMLESPIRFYCDKDIKGILNTPIKFWRTYTGIYSMPNSYTSSIFPSNLWNPPQSTDKHCWPFQPIPKLNQKCPTYVCSYGLIFSGYGLYDLEDFPEFSFIKFEDNNKIKVPLRKLILKLIVPKNQEKYDLIDTSKVSGGKTGYGDYQRFLPGPGLGMNYQPNKKRIGKKDPIDLSISTYNKKTGEYGCMPVPFPNFKGNSWGPYEPDERFQNNSLLATLDELYLNGDLDNLNGDSIIHPDYDPTKEEYTYEMFINNTKTKDVNFQNFMFTSNPNIKNAMRISYEKCDNYTKNYVTKSMIKGNPGEIINNNEIILETLKKKLEKPEKISLPEIKYIDKGINNGEFIKCLSDYLNFLLENIPEQNIIMKIFDDIVPLTVNVTNKTQNKNVWEKSFNPPIVDIDELKMEFYTEKNDPIEIERCIGFESKMKDKTIFFSKENKFCFNQKFSETFYDDSKYTECGFICPFKNENHTKNIFIKFNIISYETENKNITEIYSNNFKQENRKNIFKDHTGNIVELLPLASNMDNYST